MRPRRVHPRRIIIVLRDGSVMRVAVSGIAFAAVEAQAAPQRAIGAIAVVSISARLEPPKRVKAAAELAAEAHRRLWLLPRDPVIVRAEAPESVGAAHGAYENADDGEDAPVQYHEEDVQGRPAPRRPVAVEVLVRRDVPLRGIIVRAAAQGVLVVPRVLEYADEVDLHLCRQAGAVLEQRRQGALAVRVLAVEAGEAGAAGRRVAGLWLRPEIVHGDVQDDLHGLVRDERAGLVPQRVRPHAEDELAIEVPAHEALGAGLPLDAEERLAVELIIPQHVSPRDAVGPVLVLVPRRAAAGAVPLLVEFRPRPELEPVVPVLRRIRQRPIVRPIRRYAGCNGERRRHIRRAVRRPARERFKDIDLRRAPPRLPFQAVASVLGRRRGRV
mmetsp:Transcript_6911/g.20169  ORF Transcript_6911/g.20169 Transcript_6911/m.20169 type:complete len:386 (-) Transcript_6911:990-2147(-)